MAGIFLSYVDEPLSLRVAVDHAVASHDPENPRVCLYLNDDGIDPVCVEMTRRQFQEMLIGMEGAAATGLPLSLRWPSVVI